jgi:phage terminase large subunit
MVVPVTPELLHIPKKLTPMITEFNSYEYLYAEGGRGGGKSHGVGRFLLYLGEQKKLRIVCGREIQANIEESVFTLLVDYIDKFDLDYQIFTTRGQERLVHRRTGSVIKFKGFREQGSVSIKGLEGVDILWIDEAQSITSHTLSIIIPTIRKNNRRVFFTMNRFLRDDPVHEFCTSKGKACLHISINYFDNEFAPPTIKTEALDCKERSEQEYRHVWLGEPIKQADNHLFDFDKLHESFETKPFGGLYKRQRVLGIDFAAQGNDSCVAATLDRLSVQHWGLREQIAWDYNDSMESVGKIINLIGDKKPDITMLDYSGMGKVVFDRLNEVIGSLPNHRLLGFDGGSTKGIDTKQHANIKTAAYFRLKEWFENRYLCISKSDKEVINQAEKVKFKYRSNGSRIMPSKPEMKLMPPRGIGMSPDELEGLMMAVWGTKFLGTEVNKEVGSFDSSQKIRRVNKSSRTNTGQKRNKRVR